MPKHPHIYYLDAGIINNIGHNLETVKHLIKSFNKFGDLSVFAGAKYERSPEFSNIIPVLPYGSPHWMKDSNTYRILTKLHTKTKIKLFFYLKKLCKKNETYQALKSQKIISGSIYVINSVELDDAFLQASSIFKLDRFAQVKIVLHYSPFIHDATILREHVKDALKSFAGIKNADQITFFADTSLLCNLYSGLIGKEVTKIPIPHLSRRSSRILPGQKIPVTYFGVYSEAKSPQLLSKIIPACRKFKLNDWQIKITYIARNPIIDNFCQHMRSMNGDVIYDEGPFTSKEVNKIFSKGGIVLIPYHSHDYEIQSSGIVMEAIVAGCVPIVSLSMADADTLSKIDTIFVARPNNPNDYIDRIISISRNFDKYQSKLKELKRVLKSFHNPDNFVKTLLET